MVVTRSEPEPSFVDSAHPSSTYPCYTDTTLSPAGTHENRGIDTFPGVLNLYDYPDGSKQGVVVRRRGAGNPLSPDDINWYRALSEKERESINRQRAVRRAVVQIQRFIRTHNLVRLLTFTNGGPEGGWETCEQAIRDVVAYLQGDEARRLYGGGPVVVVAERGGAHGRVHVHVALGRGHRLNYSKCILSWTRFLNGRGFTSSTGFHRWHAGDEQGKHAGGFTNAAIAAAYISKYMSKELESVDHSAHGKRYRALFGEHPVPEQYPVDSLLHAVELVRDTFSVYPSEWFCDAEGIRAGFWFDVGPPGGGES